MEKRGKKSLVLLKSFKTPINTVAILIKLIYFIFKIEIRI